jgi:hypothetical protein
MGFGEFYRDRFPHVATVAESMEKENCRAAASNPKKLPGAVHGDVLPDEARRKGLNVGCRLRRVQSGREHDRHNQAGRDSKTHVHFELLQVVLEL